MFNELAEDSEDEEEDDDEDSDEDEEESPTKNRRKRKESEDSEEEDVETPPPKRRSTSKGSKSASKNGGSSKSGPRSAENAADVKMVRLQEQLVVLQNAPKKKLSASEPKELSAKDKYVLKVVQTHLYQKAKVITGPMMLTKGVQICY